MRKNIWIGLFVAGANVLIVAAELLISGLVRLFFVAPTLSVWPWPLLVVWFLYGPIVGGTIALVIGLILIVAGYVRYSHERQYDIEMGLTKLKYQA